MEADSDAQTMVKVAAGDRQAFAILFDRYHASVSRFALRFVGDRERAEEAIGRKLSELIIRPVDRERHNNGLARYLATGSGPVLNRRIAVVGHGRLSDTVRVTTYSPSSSGVKSKAAPDPAA